MSHSCHWGEGGEKCAHRLAEGKDLRRSAAPTCCWKHSVIQGFCQGMSVFTVCFQILSIRGRTAMWNWWVKQIKCVLNLLIKGSCLLHCMLVYNVSTIVGCVYASLFTFSIQECMTHLFQLKMEFSLACLRFPVCLLSAHGKAVVLCFV